MTDEVIEAKKFDDMSLRLMVFTYMFAMVLYLLALLISGIVVVAVLAFFAVVWYAALSLGLSLTGVQPDNMVKAFQLFFTALLALFSAYTVRRFVYEDNRPIRVYVDGVLQDAEYEEYDDEDEPPEKKNKGPKYGL